MTPSGPAPVAGLDPRTKIVLILATSVTVMSAGGLLFVPAALLLAMGLAVWEGRYRRCFGLLVAAVSMWLLGWVFPLWWPSTIFAIISIACVYGIRFAVTIGIGMHVIATTSPTQMSAGLRAWRIPRAIAVTLAVVFRFFPVVGAESSAVLDAMRLRGLVGTRGIVCHPVLTLERFTVPVIAASLRATEDLSASAALRGLGSHRRPTAMEPPRLGIADLILGLVVAGLIAATLLLPAPLT